MGAFDEGEKDTIAFSQSKEVRLVGGRRKEPRENSGWNHGPDGLKKSNVHSPKKGNKQKRKETRKYSSQRKEGKRKAG